jgi:hypothetical protein
MSSLLLFLLYVPGLHVLLVHEGHIRHGPLQQRFLDDLLLMRRPIVM